MLLCGCCSTVDNWEHDRKLYPGQLLYNWLVST
jgi:hypothetical protein